MKPGVRVINAIVMMNDTTILKLSGKRRSCIIFEMLIYYPRIPDAEMAKSVQIVYAFLKIRARLLVDHHKIWHATRKAFPH